MTHPLLVATVALLVASAACAQYKVVAPDGSVTYTDRPPVTPGLKVTPLGRAGAALADSTPVAALPYELRLPAGRYPVTLYGATECPPCDAARQMLLQRGVPFSEKRVSSEEDALALERALGWRTLPSASIGAQGLRGWNAAEWASYLDAAGYPRESRMPRSWQPPPATPLVPRTASTPPEPMRAEPPTPAPATPEAPEPAPSPETPAIRF